MDNQFSEDCRIEDINRITDANKCLEILLKEYGANHPGVQILRILYPGGDHTLKLLPIDNIKSINSILQENGLTLISVNNLNGFAEIDKVLNALRFPRISQSLCISGVIEDRLAIENSPLLTAAFWPHLQSLGSAKEIVHQIIIGQEPGFRYIVNWLNQIATKILSGKIENDIRPLIQFFNDRPDIISKEVVSLGIQNVEALLKMHQCDNKKLKEYLDLLNLALRSGCLSHMDKCAIECLNDEHRNPAHAL